MPNKIIHTQADETTDEERDRVKFCKSCSRLESEPYHINVCPTIGTPPPDPELGRDLRSVEDVRRWLGHPSNHRDTRLFIIKWDGFVPYVSKYHVDRLWEGVSLAEVVIWEQMRRKRGGRHFDEEPTEQ